MTTEQASAYKTSGARWPSQPYSGCCATITYYLDPNLPSYDSYGWTDAKSAWIYSNANITFNPSGSSSSANIQLSNYWSSTDSFCAVSSWTNANFSNAIGRFNDYRSYNYSRGQAKACGTHELGHFSSIDHPDNLSICAGGAQGAIMQYAPVPQYNQCGWDAPRGDDVNGVNAQY